MKMKWTQRTDSRRAGVSAVFAALLLLAGGLLFGARVGVADTEPAPPSTAPSTAPSVELDRLLKLPDSYGSGTERRGGATSQQWLNLFDEARAVVTEADDDLKRAERELDELAGDSSSWNMAPPGASDPQSGPLNYRLLQEIRHLREEQESAKTALRALEVKADLAGVPASWRVPQGS